MNTKYNYQLQLIKSISIKKIKKNKHLNAIKINTVLQLVEKNTNLSTNISGQIVILHFHSINWVFMNICWVLRNYIDRCLYRISRFFSTMDSNQCFFKPVSYFSKLNAFKQVVTTVKDYYMSYQESKCKSNSQRGWKQHLRH